MGVGTTTTRPYDQDLRPCTGWLAARSTRGRACAGVLAHRHANGLGVQQVRNERPRAHAYTRVTSTSRSHTLHSPHASLPLRINKDQCWCHVRASCPRADANGAEA